MYPTLLAVVLFLSYFLIQGLKRRKQLKAQAATWPCPNCGKLFGEDAFNDWGIDIDTDGPLPNHCSGGALMKCSNCGKEFRFDPDGRRLDELGFYIEDDKPE